MTVARPIEHGPRGNYASHGFYPMLEVWGAASVALPAAGTPVASQPLDGYGWNGFAACLTVSKAVNGTVSFYVAPVNPLTRTAMPSGSPGLYFVANFVVIAGQRAGRIGLQGPFTFTMPNELWEFQFYAISNAGIAATIDDFRLWAMYDNPSSGGSPNG